MRALRFAVLLAAVSLTCTVGKVESTKATEVNGNNVPSKDSAKRTIAHKPVLSIVAACNSEQPEDICKYTVSIAEFVRSKLLLDKSLEISDASKAIVTFDSGDELAKIVDHSRPSSDIMILVGPFPKDKTVSNLFPINVANLSKAIVAQGKVTFPIYATVSGGGDTTVAPATFFDPFSETVLRRNITSVLGGK